jgi:signal transduction histidine kinase
MAGDELRRYLESLLPADAVAEVLRRLEAAKLESLAEFAAGAGHEINNPLAVISGRADMLLRDETDPERRRLLATIGAQALRIRDMIGDLMVFGRPPEPAPATLNLADVARTVLEQFANEIPPDVHVSCNGDPAVPVWADHTQLCVVVESLVRNALEALNGSPGRVEIEARALSASGAADDPGTALNQLIVRDTGPGLTAADREHLFDPFYSGRPAGRGLGFGLSKCWRIVTRHGGRIEVEANGVLDDQPATDDAARRTWTTFRVLWPCRRP